jgi:hypothetical protein
MKCPHCGNDSPCPTHNRRACLDPIWLTFCAVGFIVSACALYRDGSVVGGPTPETTSVPCPDGTRCPNWAPLCPQYPGERCQADTPDIETGDRSCEPVRNQPCTYCVCRSNGTVEQIATACKEACR